MKLLGFATAFAVVAFWLTMNGLLVRRVLEYRGLDDYRRGVIDFLGENVRRERRMGIYLRRGSKRIGHTSFAIERTSGPDSSGYSIEYDTRIEVDLLGKGGAVSLDGEGELDSRMVPLKIKARVMAGGLRFDMEGRREGDRLQVSVRHGGRTILKSGFPLEGLLLGDGLAPAPPIGGLRPGMTYRVPVFDPILSEGAMAEVNVLGEIAWSVGGITLDCLELETHYKGMTFRSIVTRDGELIRQDLPPPLDVFLIRETVHVKKGKG
jgi:hypothetical protein